MLTYDLRNGLDLTKEIFAPDASITTCHIPGEAFLPLDPNDPLVELAANAADHPHILQKDGRSLSVMSLQEDNPDAIVFAMSWGANFEHPIGETMVACMAKQFPDKRILSWNSFGRGEANASSRIRPGAIRHAARTGSFDLIGKEYADRIAPLLEGHDHVDLVGVSEGGRIVLSTAKYLGKRVRNVVMLDSPGTLGYRYVPYTKQFTSEKVHSDEYVAATMDPLIEEFVNEHHDPIRRSKVIAKDIARGILLDHYYRSPKAMGKAGLWTDLCLAVPHISGKLAFILPGQTQVNDPIRVHADLHDIQSRFKGTELALWTLPGSHAIINSGLMVEATLLAYALNR